MQLYSSYLRKWGLYCLLHKVSPSKPTISQVVRFLRFLEDEGSGYGAVNTAQCALSLILPQVNGQSVGKPDMVRYFIKAMHNRNPPSSKCSRIWNVSIVFNHLQKMQDNKHQSLMQFGFKLPILFLLITGHRRQTIAMVCLTNAQIDNEEALFHLDKFTMSDRLGDTLSSVHVLAYTRNKKLLYPHFACMSTALVNSELISGCF